MSARCALRSPCCALPAPAAAARTRTARDRRSRRASRARRSARRCGCASSSRRAAARAGRSSCSCTAAAAGRLATSATRSSPALDALGDRAPVVAFPNGGDHSYWHDRDDGDWGRYVLDEVIPKALERIGRRPGPRRARRDLAWAASAPSTSRTRAKRALCAVGGHSPAIWRTSGETAPGAFDDAADFAPPRRHPRARSASRTPSCGSTPAAPTRSCRATAPSPAWRACACACTKAGTTVTTGIATSPVTSRSTPEHAPPDRPHPRLPRAVRDAPRSPRRPPTTRAPPRPGSRCRPTRAGRSRRRRLEETNELFSTCADSDASVWYRFTRAAVGQRRARARRGRGPRRGRSTSSGASAPSSPPSTASARARTARPRSTSRTSTAST